MKSNSFWNDTEIVISAQIIQTMLSLNVSPLQLGVISLCKLCFHFLLMHQLTFFFIFVCTRQGTSQQII